MSEIYKTTYAITVTSQPETDKHQVMKKIVISLISAVALCGCETTQPTTRQYYDVQTGTVVTETVPAEDSVDGADVVDILRTGLEIWRLFQ